MKRQRHSGAERGGQHDQQSDRGRSHVEEHEAAELAVHRLQQPRHESNEAP
jgi:hypothetical protein